MSLLSMRTIIFILSMQPQKTVINKSYMKTYCLGNKNKSYMKTSCLGNKNKSYMKTYCLGNKNKSYMKTYCLGNKKNLSFHYLCKS